jgi:hypothetical protein
MKRFDDIFGMFTAGYLLLQIVTHPEGTKNLVDTIRWAIEYYQDWDYYASRFMD